MSVMAALRCRVHYDREFANAAHCVAGHKKGHRCFIISSKFVSLRLSKTTAR
jgi:hypothetical protein